MINKGRVKNHPESTGGEGEKREKNLGVLAHNVLSVVAKPPVYQKGGCGERL